MADARGTDQFHAMTAGALGFQEGFGAIATEWQDFVSRRLRENYAFAQQVATFRTPEQFWFAYVNYLQRAMTDFSHECTTMAHLMAETTTKSFAAAQALSRFP
jgi:hypothetical protein